MAKTNPRHQARQRRKLHIRKVVRGTPDRPRLCVFRSARHIYAQIIDDTAGRTITEASTLSPELKDIDGSKGNAEAAKKVGGYVNHPRYPASKSVLLELAEATAVAGEPEVALQYARQVAVRGQEGDLVFLAIAEKMIELDRTAAAKEVVQGMRGQIAAVCGWYAISAAEAAARSERLSAMYVQTTRLRNASQKAAILAGVAAGLQAR